MSTNITDEALHQAFLNHRSAHGTKAAWALVQSLAGCETLEDVPDDAREALIAAFTEGAANPTAPTALPSATDVYAKWNAAGKRSAE